MTPCLLVAATGHEQRPWLGAASGADGCVVEHFGEGLDDVTRGESSPVTVDAATFPRNLPDHAPPPKELTMPSTTVVAVDDEVLAEYEISQRTIRSGRSDWTVGPLTVPDFVAALRTFFDAFDTEITKRSGDPIATAHALMKIEALMADGRHVARRLRESTAAALKARRVRRLTIEGAGVLEASSSVDRTGWRTSDLTLAYLTIVTGVVAFVDDRGEMRDPVALAAAVADLYGPSTAPRLTPLRDVGLDPDDYCDIKRDENGDPIRTPSIVVKVNEARS